MKFIVLAAILMIIGGQDLSAQTLPTLPKPAQATVDHALDICKRNFAESHYGPILKRDAEEFAQDLDMLTKQVDGAVAKKMTAFEGQDITAKLVAIAWDHKSHIDRYRELIDVYINFKYDPGAHVIHTPQLLPKHATEEYRLAWEYLLLSPALQTAGNLFERRVTEALCKIDNPLSNYTLAYVFRLTMLPQTFEQGSTSERYQIAILQSLGDNPNQANLDTILQCLTLWYKKPNFQTNHSIAEFERGDVFSAPYHVHRMLFEGALLPKTWEKWHEVIVAYSEANNVNFEHKQLLESTRQLKTTK